MFNIASIYPRQDGSQFDFEYYLNSHMPRSIAPLSGAKGHRGVSVERGIDIADPPIASSFVAMRRYYFDTLDDFLAAFMPHADGQQGDIASYTNINRCSEMVSITPLIPTFSLREKGRDRGYHFGTPIYPR